MRPFSSTDYQGTIGGHYFHLENIPEFSLVPPEKVQLLIYVISVLELGCLNNSCGEIIERLKLLICKVQET